MVDLNLKVPATEEVEVDAETLAAIDRALKPPMRAVLDSSKKCGR